LDRAFPISLANAQARNVTQFTAEMTAAGFDVGGSPDHPICPIHLGDARLAGEFAEEAGATRSPLCGYNPVNFTSIMLHL
jgi:7-keto-8-aminopelargonate synthetase-like enzyme